MTMWTNQKDMPELQFIRVGSNLKDLTTQIKTNGEEPSIESIKKDYAKNTILLDIFARLLHELV